MAAAVRHLGYVQIDTINVIERCHHHILFSRIPAYRRTDLRQAQTTDKSVFEYWAHALAYLPTETLRFFVADMKHLKHNPGRWFSSVQPKELRKVLRLVKRDGALTIRDIEEEPQEKQHLWASRKPSKRALEYAFFLGALAISERNGMLKTYELMSRHFGWDKPPKAASAAETTAYLLDRALARAGHRQPRFDLPPRRAAQGRRAQADRRARPPRRIDAGRARRRRQAGALGAAGGDRGDGEAAMPAWCTSCRRSIR